MLAAVIAAIVTLVVLFIVAVIVLLVRRNAEGNTAASEKKAVQSIQSVADFGAVPGAKDEGRGGQVQSKKPSVQPSDSLKSRFVAMGVLVAAIFGTLSAKLFSMQVLSSEEYRKKAESNLYTTVSTPAPRGCIYDADGVPLVRNRTSLTVLADSEAADDRNTVQRLSAVLGIPHNIVRQRIQDASSGAQSQRVVASDVSLRNIAFITEHSDAFPGVTTENRTVREYPYGALAAHILGYTGLVDEDDLKTISEGSEVQLGDEIGKGGVESVYDSVLAGSHGQRTVVADAEGRVREVRSVIDPEKGNDVYLTIKAPVQLVADRALANLIAPEGMIGSGTGTSASVVALDITTGEVVAMANYPTYAPESFIGGISNEIWELFNAEEAHKPLMNRAIEGAYPAASTFKAFTGLAGLAYGFADTERTWYCSGGWDYWGADNVQHCWLLSGHGNIDFRSGIVQSCDAVFYEIAKDFYEAGLRGELDDSAMQEYIRRFGFGSRTGIDLPGEIAGRIPTPEWKAEYFKDYPEEAQWRGGDMTNMSIGQGYVLITPLQLAAAYAGVATGKIMKPHLLKEVRNAQGDAVAGATKETWLTPDVPADHYAIMRDALWGVANEESTVARLFAEYGIDAAAKTGTAEVAGQDDTAWFACYAPYDNPKYVVACVVEEGGGGAAVAAPIGAEVLDALMRYDAGTLDTVMTPVAGSSGKSIEREHYSNTSGRQD